MPIYHQWEALQYKIISFVTETILINTVSYSKQTRRSCWQTREVTPMLLGEIPTFVVGVWIYHQRGTLQNKIISLVTETTLANTVLYSKQTRSCWQTRKVTLVVEEKVSQIFLFINLQIYHLTFNEMAFRHRHIHCSYESHLILSYPRYLCCGVIGQAADI